MEETCEDCGGLGYLADQTYGETEAVVVAARMVQACDNCSKYPGDIDAAQKFAQDIGFEWIHWQNAGDTKIWWPVEQDTAEYLGTIKMGTDVQVVPGAAWITGLAALSALVEEDEMGATDKLEMTYDLIAALVENLKELHPFDRPVYPGDLDEPLCPHDGTPLGLQSEAWDFREFGETVEGNPPTWLFSGAEEITVSDDSGPLFCRRCLAEFTIPSAVTVDYA